MLTQDELKVAAIKAFGKLAVRGVSVNDYDDGIVTLNADLGRHRAMSVDLLALFAELCDVAKQDVVVMNSSEPNTLEIKVELSDPTPVEGPLLQRKCPTCKQGLDTTTPAAGE